MTKQTIQLLAPPTWRGLDAANIGKILEHEDALVQKIEAMSECVCRIAGICADNIEVGDQGDAIFSYRSCQGNPFKVAVMLDSAPDTLLRMVELGMILMDARIE